jgi:hypothetical protein
MLFGTALLVKLVPMYLLAVAALATLVGHDAWNTRSAHVPGRVSDTRIAAIRAWITDMLLLLVTTAATFVSLDVLVDRGAYLTHFSQTWASHFGGTKNLAYGSPADRPFHWSALLKNWDLTIPALVGVAGCIRSVLRDRKADRRVSADAIIPVFWLALALTLFGLHRPWWERRKGHISTIDI